MNCLKANYRIHLRKMKEMYIKINSAELENKWSTHLQTHQNKSRIFLDLTYVSSLFRGTQPRQPRTNQVTSANTSPLQIVSKINAMVPNKEIPIYLITQGDQTNAGKGTVHSGIGLTISETQKILFQKGYNIRILGICSKPLHKLKAIFPNANIDL